MKKILNIISTALLMLTSISAFSQSSSNKDEARIVLASWVPQQIEAMPVSARKMLANKLSQVASKNGVGGSVYNARFIITANVAVVTKDIIPGPPTMHAMNLDVTLYIGDGIDGTVYESHTMSVKGVGTNETKAYMAGIKRINANNPEIKSFVNRGKEKIIAYYKANCDFIIKEAKTLEAQNKFPEAILKLTSVPKVCSECYNKSMDAVEPIYKKHINRDCQVKLQKAKGIWNASQDMEAAEKAGAILASIDPASEGFSEVKTLSSKIEAKVKQIDAREWKYVLKEQAQESERIQAIRDIGVAYGKNQPKNVTYKTIW